MMKKVLGVACVAMLPTLAFADDGATATDAAATDAAATEEMAFEITGDAEKGEKVFKKCKACHMVGDDAKNKTGPVLNGILGRQMAAVEDFGGYSDTLVAWGEEGRTWTPEELTGFLAKPKEYAEGTKMSFAGLRKEKDQANVIAYLATFPAAAE